MNEGHLSGWPALKKAWLSEPMKLIAKAILKTGMSRGLAMSSFIRGGNQGEVLDISYMCKSIWMSPWIYTCCNGA